VKRQHQARRQPVTLRERVHGALFGLAVGEARGGKAAGATAGATARGSNGIASMAIALGESLLDFHGVDASDIRRRADALDAASINGERCALLRVGVVPLYYATDPRAAMRRAGESSVATTASLRASDACRYFAGLMIGALAGVPKDELLMPRYSPIPGFFEKEPLQSDIDAVASGSYRRAERPEVQETGPASQPLAAALWAFDGGDTFAEGLALATSLGGSALAGALYGQLAGAWYGVHAIPGAWRMELDGRGVLEELADRLYKEGIEQASG
jgi:ADP-ribosylglycohydrolase